MTIGNMSAHAGVEVVVPPRKRTLPESTLFEGIIRWRVTPADLIVDQDVETPLLIANTIKQAFYVLVVAVVADNALL